jgi:hypothetical protein
MESWQEEDGGTNPSDEEPEDLEGSVVRSEDGEWNELAKTESAWSDEINGAEDTCEHLDRKCEHRKNEEFVACSLRWSDNIIFQILSGERFQVKIFIFFELTVHVQDSANTNEENEDGDGTPQHSLGSWKISNKRIIWPIVSVTVFLTWSSGDCHPATPEEEGGEIFDLLGVLDVLNGPKIRISSFGIITPVVKGDILPCILHGFVHDNDIPVFVISVVAKLSSDSCLDGIQVVLAFDIRVVFVVFGHGHTHDMKGLGCEVWASLSSITEEGSVLHKSSVVEDFFTIVDHFLRDDDFSVRSDVVTQRRDSEVGNTTEVANTSNTDRHDDYEVESPVPFMTEHCCPCLIGIF